MMIMKIIIKIIITIVTMIIIRAWRHPLRHISVTPVLRDYTSISSSSPLTEQGRGRVRNIIMQFLANE